MKLNIPGYIDQIAPYVPGKPIEALEREYGIADSIKLASNENPLGSSPKALEAVSAAMGKLHRYPDGACYVLMERLAGHLGVDKGQIVLGNGSDDLLGLLSRVLLQPGDEVIIPTPSFLMYKIVTQSAGAVPVPVALKDLHVDLAAVLEKVGPRTRIIFICNPNNPTGTILEQSALDAFLQALPEHVVVVMDEAYIEFVRERRCASGLSVLNGPATVVTLRTFSKIYGLAGLRVGYGVMPAFLAEWVQRVRMPFNVNSLAQVAAAAALDDTDFFDQTLATIHQGLDFLYRELSRRNLRFFPSQANFFLIDGGRPADDVFEGLLRRGVIVRSMTSYGFPNYIRINIGLPAENQRFLDALDQVLSIGSLP